MEEGVSDHVARTTQNHHFFDVVPTWHASSPLSRNLSRSSYVS